MLLAPSASPPHPFHQPPCPTHPPTHPPTTLPPTCPHLPAPQEDEFLIVASDGLWDVLPPREAVQWARKEFKAKKVGEGGRRE